MKFNSCFNFKLSKCIGVFGSYICGVIDCNEWNTEKHHECANRGKVKQLELWWQLYVTWLPEWDVRNFRSLNFCWTEGTASTAYDNWHFKYFSASLSKCNKTTTNTVVVLMIKQECHWI